MNKTLQNILYGFFILFIFYVIFELLRKVLGGSWGFEELVIALLVANIGYSFYLKESLGRHALGLQSAITKIDSKVESHLGWHKGKDDGS